MILIGLQPKIHTFYVGSIFHITIFVPEDKIYISLQRPDQNRELPSALFDDSLPVHERLCILLEELENVENIDYTRELVNYTIKSIVMRLN